MLVIPLLELRDGAAIRPVTTGAERTSVRENPFEVVREWVAAGFHRIHVLDLDAQADSGSNERMLDELLRDAACELQVEASVESTDEIQRLVDAGATHVVLGPRALDDDSWLTNVADLFPGLLIVATDARQRRVARRGWVRTFPVDVLDLVRNIGALPLSGLLVAATPQQTPLGVGDLTLLEDIADASELPLIVRGGVGSAGDLRAVEHRGVSAVVIGEPLYSGALDAWSVGQEFG